MNKKSQLTFLLLLAFTVAASGSKRKYADKHKWKNAYKVANQAMENKMRNDLAKEGIPQSADTDEGVDEKRGVEDSKAEYKRLKNNMDEMLKKLKSRKSRASMADTQDMEEETPSSRNKRMSDTPVYSLGANPELLMEDAIVYADTPREDMLRDRSATDTDSCTSIRNVPAELRDPQLFFNPIHVSYQKYTEAYGIPIVGSLDVTDAGLARACYEVKFLLASRYDIRNVFYKMYARIALIGDNEEQTSLFEYSTWDSAYWNDRVRGLSPTLTIPVTSAGDDNMRCKTTDRYAKEDILLHEFAHGIHSMAAVYTIPGFQKRLWNAFKSAINSGKYASKYASTNLNEYFAVGAQIYFDSYDKNDYKYTNEEGVEVPITNRDALRVYDPDLVDLLDEVFPCNNHFVHRCTWKDCSIDNYELVYSKDEVVAKSMCKVIKSHFKQDNATACGDYTCYHLGNAFNFKKTNKASYCYVLDCTDSTDLQISQSSGAFDVYKIKQIPQMDFSAEDTQPMDSHCSLNSKTVYVTPDVEKSKRCNTPIADRIDYGPDPLTSDKKLCKSWGGCYGTDYGCYYPTQECVNHSFMCPLWSTYVDENGVDECTRNAPFMLNVCSLACDACKYSYRLQETEHIAIDMCQDDFPNCWDLGCQDYKNVCKLYCGLCELPADWPEILGIPDYEPQLLL